jgi:hypothetical protein
MRQIGIAAASWAASVRPESGFADDGSAAAALTPPAPRGHHPPTLIRYPL